MNENVDILASVLSDRRKLLADMRLIKQKLNYIKENPSWWKAGRAGGQDQYAGMPPAIRLIDEILQIIDNKYEDN
jgi:hypothetical protein